MNIKTTIASLVAIGSIVTLSACGASTTPALEKGQPVDQAVETEAVPQECLDAFSDATRVDDALSEGITVAADAVMYALNNDSDGLDKVNAQLDELVPEVQDARSGFAVAAAVCESSAPADVCIDALNSAEEVDDLLGQALQSSSRSIDYAYNLNADGLDEETALIEELTPKVGEARTDFASQSAQCRANEGV